MSTILRKFLMGFGAMALMAPLAIPAQATPARIILLRHGEKLDDYALCDMGRVRADALAQQFLGRNAAQSLFGAKGKPDALMAITVHTYETIAPLAKSWGMPVTDYAVALGPKGQKASNEADETFETRLAAHDVMTDKRYDGKTVVMVWEHKRIASAKLEKENPGEPATLRQLLHLDRLADVPRSWPLQTYDYIWIVDYKPHNSVPVSFHMVRETFTGTFANLPANDWDTPEPKHVAAGCLK
ncbi:MAG TPA: hypothetical protein VL574_00935 [Stellaceae bacterium]|nr:hypothetical protein [Stellaceae bacterium]